VEAVGQGIASIGLHGRRPDEPEKDSYGVAEYRHARGPSSLPEAMRAAWFPGCGMYIPYCDLLV
jgi:hypothetical protein